MASWNRYQTLEGLKNTANDENLYFLSCMFAVDGGRTIHWQTQGNQGDGDSVGPAVWWNGFFPPHTPKEGLDSQALRRFVPITLASHKIS